MENQIGMLPTSVEAQIRDKDLEALTVNIYNSGKSTVEYIQEDGGLTRKVINGDLNMRDYYKKLFQLYLEEEQKKRSKIKGEIVVNTKDF